MRIGICDDEPVFLEIMRKELEAYYRSLDLEVRAFSDGKELEEAVKKDGPHLLPGLFRRSGAVRRLQVIFKNPAKRFVISSKTG